MQWRLSALIRRMHVRTALQQEAQNAFAIRRVEDAGGDVQQGPGSVIWRVDVDAAVISAKRFPAAAI